MEWGVGGHIKTENMLHMFCALSCKLKSVKTGYFTLGQMQYLYRFCDLQYYIQNMFILCHVS